MTTVQEKFREDQFPTYSHNTEEKVRKRKAIKAFYASDSFPGNSLFCPQCHMYMISFNAPGAIPLHVLAFLVTDHEDNGTCLAVCILCQEAPPFHRQVDKGSVLLTKPLVLSSKSNAHVIIGEHLEELHSQCGKVYLNQRHSHLLSFLVYKVNEAMIPFPKGCSIQPHNRVPQNYHYG